MRTYFFLFLLILSYSLNAKEWKNLKVYQNTIHRDELLPNDWLKSDRVHNTITWQKANLYNLITNSPQEYNTVIERRDFYKWINNEIKVKGHEVNWFKMTYFISYKLHIMETFPFNIFTNKAIMNYAFNCSESIFNNAFANIKELYGLETILTKIDAMQWDQEMLYKEQYVWAEKVIKNIDSNNLERIQNILQGKFLYSLLVPKYIRFYGNLSNPEERYRYAINVLRPYCEKRFK